MVLVRRLGAVSRETFEPAIRRLHGESVGRCSDALDGATLLGRFSRRRISRADEFPAIGRAAGQGIAYQSNALVCKDFPTPSLPDLPNCSSADQVLTVRKNGDVSAFQCVAR